MEQYSKFIVLSDDYKIDDEVIDSVARILAENICETQMKIQKELDANQ